MNIIWKGPGQHTEWGLISTGDAVDTTALGIPDEIVGNWTASGFAEVVEGDKPKRTRRVAKEEE